MGCIKAGRMQAAGVVNRRRNVCKEKGVCKVGRKSAQVVGNKWVVEGGSVVVRSRHAMCVPCVW